MVGGGAPSAGFFQGVPPRVTFRAWQRGPAYLSQGFWQASSRVLWFRNPWGTFTKICEASILAA